jgi:hypothetical protein
MRDITIDELKEMTEAEGLVLQGCGGDLREWVDGVNAMLTEEGILLDGDTFKDVRRFEHNGLICLLFSMGDVKLAVGKLALWRLATHQEFGGTWLSDYLPNYLGIDRDDPEKRLSVQDQIRTHRKREAARGDAAEKPRGKKDEPQL